MKLGAAVTIAVVAVALIVVLFLFHDRGLRAIQDEDPSAEQRTEIHPTESRSLAGGKLRSSGDHGSVESIQFAQPVIQGSSAIERVLTLSSPEVRSLFDQGLERLVEGYFLAARQSFREILLFKNDNAMPLAHWAIGLTYYREGGTDNLIRAADQFGMYYRLYETRLDLEEFAQAAAINIGVITIELSNSSLEENLKRTMAGAAIKLMSNFLARWPQAPQAQAARAAILNLQGVLKRQR